ncbi:hypothetical protein VFPBJ_04082 [Purpureocillium lilacinum]|uniref:Uncharacterized protein n=1 Tax=Purpureocillium lilacinum TaxID=33203 RepID=A0A179GVH4_PURLI|nr:hypothetical protein VFPBJ_04082 [Purpureocillium lilacinum]
MSGRCRVPHARRDLPLASAGWLSRAVTSTPGAVFPKTGVGIRDLRRLGLAGRGPRSQKRRARQQLR